MSDPVHITWHEHSVTREAREKLNGHQGCVLWFTGLSGSGKSTVANLVDHKLHERGVHTMVLDGDNIRHGLCSPPALLADRHSQEFAQRFGLGFSAEDREENIRRIGSVAELFAAAGLVTLTAFVSPYRQDRQAVRRVVEASRPGAFVEVFIDTPLEICEARDPKGLYKKARAGELKGMTGIDDPYESPEKPELHLQGGDRPAEELADEVVAWLIAQGKVAGK